MNFLKNIGKHYEKVLLGAVLLGLLVAVILLPFKVSGDKQALVEKRDSIIHRKVPPLPDLDLTVAQAAVEQARTPAQLQLSAPPHNVFNPVQWQKTPNGQWIKMERGFGSPQDVAVTDVSDLFLIISFESVGASGSNYLIKVERQTETTSNKARWSRYVELNGKTDLFTLREVRGPMERPIELALELHETGERVTIAPDRPFKRVDGYTASLRYDPGRNTWRNRRVGDTINIAGIEYTIIAINLIATNQYEVVLSAKPSGKKTTLKFNAAP